MNLLAIRNHAEASFPNSKTELKGRNLRFGEVEAVLIERQLRRIHSLVGHRRKAGLAIMDSLGESIFEPPKIAKDVDHDFYILGLKLKDSQSRRRSEVFQSLSRLGIPGLQAKYVNTHNIPAFERFKRNPLLNAEKLHNHSFIGIYMCGVNWTDDLVNYTIESLNKF